MIHSGASHPPRHLRWRRRADMESARTVVGAVDARRGRHPRRPAMRAERRTTPIVIQSGVAKADLSRTHRRVESCFGKETRRGDRLSVCVDSTGDGQSRTPVPTMTENGLLRATGERKIFEKAFIILTASTSFSLFLLHIKIPPQAHNEE